MIKVAGRRQTGQPPASRRHARAAQCRAIADSEHRTIGRAAFLVGLRRQVAKTAVFEAMRHTEGSRQTDLGLEPGVECHDIHCNGAIRQHRGGHPVRPGQRRRSS